MLGLYSWDSAPLQDHASLARRRQCRLDRVLPRQLSERHGLPWSSTDELSVAACRYASDAFPDSPTHLSRNVTISEAQLPASRRNTCPIYGIQLLGLYFKLRSINRLHGGAQNPTTYCDCPARTGSMGEGTSAIGAWRMGARGPPRPACTHASLRRSSEHKDAQ